MPTRRRLNFSVPELVDDRAQAVVAARAPALAEAQLAERQREVVGDDEQVAERRVLARQHLPHREPGVVHVGQRLDEGQVEAAEAAHDDVRGVALAALPGPAGTLGQPVHDQPADVMARPGVLGARIAQTHDDLHDHLHDTPTSPGPRARGIGRNGTRSPSIRHCRVRTANRETRGTMTTLRRAGALFERVLLPLTIIGLVLGLVLTWAGQHELAVVAWSVPSVIVAVRLAWSIVRELLAGRMGVDVVAILAITGALLLGEFFAAAVIAVMLATGEALERYADGRAHRELSALLGRAPRTAERYIDGVLETVALDRRSPPVTGFSSSPARSSRSTATSRARRRDRSMSPR